MILVLFLLILSYTESQIILKSPFGDISKICPRRDKTYYVDGYISSPYIITPFKDDFQNPNVLNYKEKVCREDKHCLYSYDIDIKETRLSVFGNAINKCINKETWFLSYNGVVPGPTIIIPTGHESIVRFNNKITRTYFKSEFDPCLPNNKRLGRPISVHLHGSASLPPYDGWAEDETCFGEAKDYVYPNFRSGTGWYHDHALHITAQNAYLGLAGMYFISPKKELGGCGEPWNLDNIEEKHFILNDKLIDRNCELYINTFDYHKNNLYGDINLVSGIPFPNIKLDAKTYRFRLLNAAVSRPYLIQIKTSKNIEISSKICKVVATDGGFRDAPVEFSIDGLLMGVAERYEIVCDFSDYKNKELYFYNNKNDEVMKDVPYFCHSHLIGKFIIGNSNIINSKFESYDYNKGALNIVNKVLSTDDISNAFNLINNDNPHRTFDFGRSNGHWTINGESWNSMKIAADNVGQNTWELWKFKSGGGWFHPVHIHLIDFFLLKREGSKFGLQKYEELGSKDVFYLGPGETIWTIARFGAHKGDYMFHCHNLIHEDNDMMRAIRVINGNNGKNALSSEKYILNPLHNIIYNNWGYDDPMYGNTSAKPIPTVPIFNLNYFKEVLNKNLYRIFYPLSEDIQLYGNFYNPWQAKWC